MNGTFGAVVDFNQRRDSLADKLPNVPDKQQTHYHQQPFKVFEEERHARKKLNQKHRPKTPTKQHDTRNAARPKNVWRGGNILLRPMGKRVGEGSSETNMML